MKRKHIRAANGLIVASLLALMSACGGGGGGGGSAPPPPQPTITAVSVTCPSSITVGSSASCTATVTGTGSFSSGVTWTSSNTSVATVNSSGSVTGVAAGTATITATSTEDTTKSGSANVTIAASSSITAVTVTCPASINIGASSQCSAQVTGTGTFSSTVNWSTSSAAVATVNSSGSVTGVSTGTATITATSTQDTSKSGSASVTVGAARKITIGLAAGVPIENQEVYFEYPNIFQVGMNCTGCVSTDSINEKDSTGNLAAPVTLGNATSWFQTFSSFGNSSGMVQRLIEVSLSGTDGAVSNTFDVAYAGSQNAVVADSSGNFYYCCSVAVNTPPPAAAAYSLKFSSGSTTSSQINASGPAIAIDTSSQTLYFTEISSLTPSSNGIEPVPLSTGIAGTLIPITNGEPLAIDAADGLVCVTVPSGKPTPNTGADAVICRNSSGAFSAPGIPSGSQPAAIKVIDSTDFVVYGRGDQTLRWYTVSGSAAAPAGTLQLSKFTAINSSYWSSHPVTGGWNMALEGGTLAVMGQVVGSTGVTQELALVNDAGEALIGYANLPAGTLRIAADPSNSAFIAAYPDFSGASPVTRFVRVGANNQTFTTLTSTSPVVPAAGLAVTPDGSQIGTFAAGKADFGANK